METGNSPTQIQGKYCRSALGLAEMMGEALSMEGDQDKKSAGKPARRMLPVDSAPMRYSTITASAARVSVPAFRHNLHTAH